MLPEEMKAGIIKQGIVASVQVTNLVLGFNLACKSVRF